MNEPGTVDIAPPSGETSHIEAHTPSGPITTSPVGVAERIGMIPTEPSQPAERAPLTIDQQTQAAKIAEVAWGGDPVFERRRPQEIGDALVLFEAVAKGDMTPAQAAQISGTKTAEIAVASGKDSLTGLNIRTEELSDAQAALELAYITGTPISLLMMDLDHFKPVNDKLGHQAGDRALEVASRQIKNRLRPYDLGIRYGGDEFLVLTPNTTGEDALSVARRIGEEGPAGISEEMSEAGYTLPSEVTYSIGMVEELPAGQSRNMARERIHELVRLADTATYIAKGLGRDAIVSARMEGETEIYTDTQTQEQYSVERDTEGKVTRSFKYPVVTEQVT